MTITDIKLEEGKKYKLEGIVEAKFIGELPEGHAFRKLFGEHYVFAYKTEEGIAELFAKKESTTFTEDKVCFNGKGVRIAFYYPTTPIGSRDDKYYRLLGLLNN